jgi:hypothetical protein
MYIFAYVNLHMVIDNTNVSVLILLYDISTNAAEYRWLPAL